ncbi:isocitrate/isopropylmalate dehydrogenase family protein [candidate division WOR-3 bacterium]|uniref:Isocitrate/isopropylmalate dehydrogenase family protein n=1 Tax=candidate division WOR-3 bacterium TaxID=2052148 RepID=A0A660SKT0_UNCW3|nr:MAG: isocitrate/isopropylmalate dehydrogenase family protein [candidate division WOR-3 bacterium]
MMVDALEKAKEHLAEILKPQLERVERIKAEKDWIDYSRLKPIIIGVIGGDGIGPYITQEAHRVLEHLLKDEVDKGKVEFRVIEGLTIERRSEVKKPIPDDVLVEIKKCHVLLKGPTTTPKRGDPWPNIESANVAIRKELDLFANVRPVRVPKEGIDWVFFRENTEGAYALGPYGIEVTPDLAVDFKVITRPGSERIIRLAFEYARKNRIDRVTAVTKANVVKTTDGLFLKIFYDIAKEYPEINADDWFIDIMTAKLVDPKRRTQFKILVLPNLYGDILTDEAAEFQGGVGTAGSANIGKQYAMFEAIHGTAPRMVREGRTKYADPSSVIRAGAMLLNHIGYPELGERLNMALDICGQYERKLIMTGRDTGATGREFCDYILETIQDPKLKERWQGYQEG